MKLKNTFKNVKLISTYIHYANTIYPHVVYIQLISSILNTVKIFLNIYFIGAMINSLFQKNFYRIAPIKIVVLFLSLSLLLNILTGILKIIAGSNSKLMFKNVSKKLANKMLDVDYLTFTDPDFRKLYSSVKTGFTYTGGFTIFISDLFNSIISFITTSIIASGSLFILFTSKGNTNNQFANFSNSKLFLLLLIVLVLIPILFTFPISKLNGKIMHQFFKFNIQFNRIFDYYNEVLFHEINFCRTLHLYDLSNKIIQKAKENVFDQIKSDTKYQVKSVKVDGSNTLITYFIIAVIYIFISLKAISGAILIGDVVIYVSYLQQFMSVLSTMTMAWGNRKSSFNTMNQYINFMNFKPSQNHEVGSKNKIKLDSKATNDYTIQFKNVYYQYPHSKRWILQNINLIIHPAEKISIVGLNGSGKSTLIKLLLGLISPTKGMITVNGININNFDSKEYNKLFAPLFQNYSLSAFSVLDNIVTSNPVDDDKIKRVLKLSDISDKFKNIKKGVNLNVTSKLNSNGIEFSGGEQQKLAMARALYKDSPILVLDEPTSALDAISEEKVYNNLYNLLKNKTIVCISHRMSATKFSSKIIVVNAGKIVETGNYKSLMRKHGIYYQLFHEQSKYYSYSN